MNSVLPAEVHTATSDTGKKQKQKNQPILRFFECLPGIFPKHLTYIFLLLFLLLLYIQINYLEELSVFLCLTVIQSLMIRGKSS